MTPQNKNFTPKLNILDRLRTDKLAKRFEIEETALVGKLTIEYTTAETRRKGKTFGILYKPTDEEFDEFGFGEMVVDLNQFCRDHNIPVHELLLVNYATKKGYNRPNTVAYIDESGNLHIWDIYKPEKKGFQDTLFHKTVPENWGGLEVVHGMVGIENDGTFNTKEATTNCDSTCQVGKTVLKGYIPDKKQILGYPARWL